jgi:hypothetical protein
MNLLVLLLIFPTLWESRVGKINSNTSKDTNELEWASRVGKINSNTSKDTNELEWESSVGKINSNTSKFISNSFVSTTWPNDFTSLTVNLPHSWRSF